MKREIRIFFTALMFYTRIPCPPWVDHDPAYVAASARYFSLIGWVVGGIGALVFWLCSFLFSVEISLLLSMAATIRVTGAFHEDGFADVCDGFGGGWTREKILDIMKDSRLGTFGVTGLIMILTIKFFALRQIEVNWIPMAIIGGHVLSRTLAARMLARGRYVESNNLAKAGSAARKLPPKGLMLNIVIGLLAFILLQNYLFLLVLIPLLLLEWLMFRFYSKWIGGYTGDCAGAVQQLGEIVFYLSFTALWNFI